MYISLYIWMSKFTLLGLHSWFVTSFNSLFSSAISTNLQKVISNLQILAVVIWISVMIYWNDILLFVWLLDWLLNRLLDWLLDCLLVCWPDWLIDWLIDWFIRSFINSLIHIYSNKFTKDNIYSQSFIMYGHVAQCFIYNLSKQI